MQAYAEAEAQRTALPQLPKILSFHKFSKRDKEESVDLKRKKWFASTENSPPSRSPLRPSGQDMVTICSVILNDDFTCLAADLSSFIKACRLWVSMVKVYVDL